MEGEGGGASSTVAAGGWPAKNVRYCSLTAIITGHPFLIFFRGMSLIFGFYGPEMFSSVSNLEIKEVKEAYCYVCLFLKSCT